MVILNHLQVLMHPRIAGGTTSLGVQRMIAVAWSPNNKMLAAAGSDRFIYMFDELGELQDKFSTRPVDRQLGNFSYTITGLAFSPDSTKLAVAQSDAMVFVYKIGDGFKQKKSINMKFLHKESVVQLVWPNEHQIICGLVDGKLRNCPIIQGKPQNSKTFYHAESLNISLVSIRRGTQVASGHIDWRVIVFKCGDSRPPSPLYTIEHTCEPFAIAFANNTLFVGGIDKRIILYDKTGEIVQVFDFSNDGNNSEDRDFVSACGSPNDTAVVFGSYNRMRVLQYSQKNKIWEEGGCFDALNMYTVTKLTWNPSGTRLAVGTLAGGLHIYETVLRKTKTREYDLSYITEWHIIITIKNEPVVQAEMISACEYDIFDFKLMANNRFAVGTTEGSLLICDIQNNRCSEFGWEEPGNSQRYYFDNPNVCMIFHGGFIHLIEYGEDCYLGIFKCNLENPHGISVRINERPSKRPTDFVDNKKLAYLLDPNTIRIIDLLTKQQLGMMKSKSRIDWLELNETGTKLLYRTKKLVLNFLDVKTMVEHEILENCNFVQWVPGSDAIVAQDIKMAHIWYDAGGQEPPIHLEVNGLVFDVTTEEHMDNMETFISVRENSGAVRKVAMDSGRIQFGTAIDDGDLLRAMIYLDMREQTKELEPMWRTLTKAALESLELEIAERSCYGYNDFAKAKCIKQAKLVVQLAMEDGVSHDIIMNETMARIAIINRDLESAEEFYCDNGDAESAMKMYEGFGKWDDAFRLAKMLGGKWETLYIKDYFNHMLGRGKEQVIAEFLRNNEEYSAAVSVYLENGFPGQAAMVIQNHFNEMEVSFETVRAIGKILCHYEYFVEAAQMYDAAGKKRLALRYFIDAKAFKLAVQLARAYFPQKVVALEEAWGDHDFSLKKMDDACDHYVEAGKLKKALVASLGSRQFKKAILLVNAIEDDSSIQQECAVIADHLQGRGDLDLAEEFYKRGDDVREAIRMYADLGRYDDAFRVADMSSDTRKEFKVYYLRKAEILHSEGNLAIAEKLYTVLGEIDRAICMYGTLRKFEDMLRLIEMYHPPHLVNSITHVAELLKAENNMKGAENLYLRAGNAFAVVQMYKEKDIWEDAYRVARNNLPPQDWKQILYEWASHLGAELGEKLLTRYGYLDAAVDYNCTIENFEFAFELAKHALPDTRERAYFSHAEYLEKENKIMDAADSYIAANAPKNAADMFIRNGFYQKAIECSETHFPEDLTKILVHYGKIACEDGDYKHFETALVRAKRPQLVIQLYKGKGMWKEAMRFCKEFLPSHFGNVQREYDAAISSNKIILDVQTLVDQAEEYEKMGEYRRCVDCYLKLNNTTDPDCGQLLSDCFTKAGNMSIRHFDKETSFAVLDSLCPMLMSVGNFAQAAMFHIKMGQKEKGLSALLDGDLWNAAKRTAKSMGSQWVEFVKNREIDVLTRKGSIDELASINLEAALTLLVQQGEWEICLEKAARDKSLLVVYLAKYVTGLLRKSKVLEALDAYTRFGAPKDPSHYSLYKAVAGGVFVNLEFDTFEVWSQLRDIMATQVKSFLGTEHEDGLEHEMFEKYFWAAHLYANRAAFRMIPELRYLVPKITISLLRYTDIAVCAERAYYEAGMISRDMEWDNMAFVFLNHFLDIRDVVEAGKHNNTADAKLDYGELKKTDVPKKCFVTKEYIIPESNAEEAKEWVLTSSLDTNIKQELLLDSRGEFVGTVALEGFPYLALPCLISGYPCWGETRIIFQHFYATNPADWNRFISAVHAGESEEVLNIFNFLHNWCGTTPDYQFVYESGPGSLPASARSIEYTDSS